MKVEYKVTGEAKVGSVGGHRVPDYLSRQIWIEADTPLEAAALLILNFPFLTSSICTVDEDGNMSSHPLENVKLLLSRNRKTLIASQMANPQDDLSNHSI